MHLPPFLSEKTEGSWGRSRAVIDLIHVDIAGNSNGHSQQIGEAGRRR